MAVALEEGALGAIALGAAALDDPACKGPGRGSELHSHFFLLFRHAAHAAPGPSSAREHSYSNKSGQTLEKCGQHQKRN